jgi:hypothetical protein
MIGFLGLVFSVYGQTCTEWMNCACNDPGVDGGGPPVIVPGLAPIDYTNYVCDCPTALQVPSCSEDVTIEWESVLTDLDDGNARLFLNVDGSSSFPENGCGNTPDFADECNIDGVFTSCPTLTNFVPTSAIADGQLEVSVVGSGSMFSCSPGGEFINVNVRACFTIDDTNQANFQTDDQGCPEAGDFADPARSLPCDCEVTDIPFNDLLAVRFQSTDGRNRLYFYRDSDCTGPAMVIPDNGWAVRERRFSCSNAIFADLDVRGGETIQKAVDFTRFECAKVRCGVGAAGAFAPSSFFVVLLLFATALF